MTRTKKIHRCPECQQQVTETGAECSRCLRKFHTRCVYRVKKMNKKCRYYLCPKCINDNPDPDREILQQPGWMKPEPMKPEPIEIETDPNK